MKRNRKSNDIYTWVSMSMGIFYVFVASTGFFFVSLQKQSIFFPFIPKNQIDSWYFFPIFPRYCNRRVDAFRVVLYISSTVDRFPEESNFRASSQNVWLSVGSFEIAVREKKENKNEEEKRERKYIYIHIERWNWILNTLTNCVGAWRTTDRIKKRECIPIFVFVFLHWTLSVFMTVIYLHLLNFAFRLPVADYDCCCCCCFAFVVSIVARVLSLLVGAPLIEQTWPVNLTVQTNHQTDQLDNNFLCFQHSICTRIVYIYHTVAVPQTHSLTHTHRRQSTICIPSWIHIEVERPIHIF